MAVSLIVHLYMACYILTVKWIALSTRYFPFFHILSLYLYHPLQGFCPGQFSNPRSTGHGGMMSLAETS